MKVDAYPERIFSSCDSDNIACHIAERVPHNAWGAGYGDDVDWIKSCELEMLFWRVMLRKEHKGWDKRKTIKRTVRSLRKYADLRGELSFSLWIRQESDVVNLLAWVVERTTQGSNLPLADSRAGARFADNRQVVPRDGHVETTGRYAHIARVDASVGGADRGQHRRGYFVLSSTLVKSGTLFARLIRGHSLPDHFPDCLAEDVDLPGEAGMGLVARIGAAQAEPRGIGSGDRLEAPDLEAAFLAQHE